MRVFHHEAFSVPIELGIPIISTHVNVDWLRLSGKEQKMKPYCLNNSGMVYFFAKISNKNDTCKGLEKKRLIFALEKRNTPNI